MWELYDGHDHKLGHTLLITEQELSTTVGARVLASFLDATPDEMRIAAAAPALLEALERISEKGRIEPDYDDVDDTDSAESWGLAQGAFEAGEIARAAIAQARGDA